MRKFKLGAKPGVWCRTGPQMIWILPVGDLSLAPGPLFGLVCYLSRKLCREVVGVKNVNAVLGTANPSPRNQQMVGIHPRWRIQPHILGSSEASPATLYSC